MVVGAETGMYVLRRVVVVRERAQVMVKRICVASMNQSVPPIVRVMRARM